MSTVTNHIASLLDQRSNLVILTVVLCTGLFALPILTTESIEQASPEPSGTVFDQLADLNERFPPVIHAPAYIIESHGDDLLTAAALLELLQNSDNLQRTDSKGQLAPDGLPKQSYLYQYYNQSSGQKETGIVTIANLVDRMLRANSQEQTNLGNASNDQVKMVLHQLFSDSSNNPILETLSSNASSERKVIGGQEIDYWTTTALVFTVLTDNNKLGGGPLMVNIGGGERAINKEHLNRTIGDIIAGDETHYSLWGIAIDPNLESIEQGEIAGVFIMFTIIAAVLVVGLILRSYWATALIGIGLGILMIWLKGISILLGIKGGLVIDLIVPISMVALGVDFAAHAIRRYQDETRVGNPLKKAFQIGMGGVFIALLLAMLTDSIAFLSAVSSEIEAVVHFGISATIAIVSSFLILGLVVPTVLLRLENHMGLIAFGRRSTLLGRTIGSLLVAITSGTGVILLVAVNKPAGVAIIGAVILIFLLLPAILLTKGPLVNRFSETSNKDSKLKEQRDLLSTLMAYILVTAARFRYPVVFIAMILTIGSVVFALRLDPTFDTKDFFDAKSDFVVGLDKIDEHVGPRGGEPALIYIKGDLSSPETLQAIQTFIDSLPESDYVAKNREGNVDLGVTLISTLEHFITNPFTRASFQQETGITITDKDSDQIPDTTEQIKSVFTYMLTRGVPLNATTLLLEPETVRGFLYYDRTTANNDVTYLQIGLPGTREQKRVRQAGNSLRNLTTVLDESPSIISSGVTGSPFTREGQLDATTTTLWRSLPIAAIATVLLLLFAMRSVTYAFLTVVPVLLVVAWLYGLMYLLGFGLNFVTALIGSVSVGIGIDYSIHMTQRFREEASKTDSKDKAFRKTGQGTGSALIASGVSSIVGFTIMGFAPMPLFATYGILTATMIFLAMVASLIVLPALLSFTSFPHKQ